MTDGCLLRDGSVAVGVGERVERVPGVAVAVGASWPGLPQVVLADETVRRLGLTAQLNRVVVTTSRMPTEDEEDRARAALGSGSGQLRVERGYRSEYLPGFVALIGAAGLVTFAGVAISVSLSAAEGRADLATLAAVGAPPRRRRGLAMVQAALVAGLGAGLGVALGAAIGLTVMAGLEGYPLVVPWPTVLLVGLGVPALGVLVVGLATRSRLPMIRRLG